MPPSATSNKAAVEEVPVVAAPVAASRNGKKRPKFSAEEDRVIVHETNTAKACCTPRKKMELVEEVARRLNATSHCQGETTFATVCDRFHRIVKKWKSTDVLNATGPGLRRSARKKTTCSFPWSSTWRTSRTTRQLRMRRRMRRKRSRSA